MLNARQIRGSKFEFEAQAFLESRGHVILARRLRVPVSNHRYRQRAWIEIDLLTEEEQSRTLWLVEAKNHCNAASSSAPLLSRTQYLRLMRALSSLRKLHPGRQVFWALVWRNPLGGVEFTQNPCYF